MFDKYRHHIPHTLLDQGPLIRLILRLLLLVAFVFFTLYASLIITETASNFLWNPFRRKPQRTPPECLQRKDLEHNLPPLEEDDEILNQDPKYPRTRDWIYDHTYFNLYDGNQVYTNQEYTGGTVTRKPHHEEQLMIFQVQSRAVRYFQNKYPGRYTKDNCNSIRYRTVPTVGIEADVTCNDTSIGSVDRLSLLLPLKPPKLTYHHTIHSSTSINIIMPLKGRLDNLERFMENLVQILKGTKMNIGLTVVYFDDEYELGAQRILKEAEKTPNIKTQFILLKEQFSRASGLQAGVEQTNLLGEVMFFCDVDVLFTRDFLTRCISTPVRGHQVFIPMVFSLYNPEFVYPLHKHKIPPPLKQLNVNDDHGFWRVWGHGMVCIYKADFHKIGGMDVTKKGWGGEDLNFVRRTIRTGDYKIIRSLEPGLFHRYHNKVCNDERSLYSCLKVKATTEASKRSLALWYFKQTEGLFVYGALVEGNQPHDHDDYEFKPPPEIKQPMPDLGKKIASEYKSLWLWLLFLVMVAVMGLDMFLMVQNIRLDKRRVHST